MSDSAMPRCTVRSAWTLVSLCLAATACTTPSLPRAVAVYDAQRVTVYAVARRDAALSFMQKGSDEFVLWDAATNGQSEIGVGKRITKVGVVEWAQPHVPVLAPVPPGLGPVSNATPQPAPSPKVALRPDRITVTFAFNSVALDDAAKDALRAAVSQGFTAQQITGHTDQQGSSAFNEPLSLRRAQAVLAYLQSVRTQPDTADARLVAKGKTDLETTDASNEGRSRNRRVVIEGEKP